MPNCCSSQTPTKAPTMPITMFQSNPNPKPRTICPASQPAIAPDDQHNDDAFDSDHDILPRCEK